MIRVNLLPFRAARRKESIRRHLSIYFLSVALAASIMAYFHLQLDGTLKTLKAEETRRRQELARYAGITAKLREIRQKTAEVKRKLEIIRQLESRKTGPVEMLEEIAAAVPRNRLWLQSLEAKNGMLILKGTAMDHETVAAFMNRLEGGALIQSVDLHSSRLRRLEPYQINVSDFVLSCKTTLYQQPVSPAAPEK